MFLFITYISIIFSYFISINCFAVTFTVILEGRKGLNLSEIDVLKKKKKLQEFVDILTSLNLQVIV